MVLRGSSQQLCVAAATAGAGCCDRHGSATTVVARCCRGTTSSCCRPVTTVLQISNGSVVITVGRCYNDDATAEGFTKDNDHQCCDKRPPRAATATIWCSKWYMSVLETMSTRCWVLQAATTSDGDDDHR